MLYFIANWKANKNLKEALEYVEVLTNKIASHKQIVSKLERNEIKIIIAPSFPFIFPIKKKANHNKYLDLAVQDISHFEDGAYTGEITGRMVEGVVDFAIVAHSERRKYFNEKDDLLFKKAELAVKYGLQPVYGLRNHKDSFPNIVKIVAYEPDAAIGSGKNEPVEDVLETKRKLCLKKNISYLYGGSVNRSNASLYLQTGEIDGFLIGGASLDPIHFFDIIKSA